MLLKFYAGLKDYFPTEVEVDESFSNVDALREFLIQKNPASQKLLNASRFAINSELLTTETILHNDFIIAVLPPSSGG